MATYLKTPHGLEEMASHAHGLGLRARRLLILIDGRRDTAALAGMTGDAKFEESLAQLVAGGFIAVAGPEASPIAPPATAASGTALASSAPTPAKPADAPAPTAAHAAGGESLQVARDFMMNTLRTFHGPYGKLDLLKRIHASTHSAELRALFDDWLGSISETRIGRKRADELSARLLEVLPG